MGSEMNWNRTGGFVAVLNGSKARERRIWLTWEVQRRNRSTSQAFDAVLHEVTTNEGGLRRYVECALRTFLILFREKPDVIFSQNPSIVLSAICALWGRVVGSTVVVDAHNVAIEQLTDEGVLRKWLARWIVRNVRMVLVSNRELLTILERHGGRGVVLPDPLPALKLEPGVVCGPAESTFTILFVCSWADDEPYQEVIRAAATLHPSIRVLITGKPDLPLDIVKNLPSNVVLTGFVQEKCYVRLLHEVDVVMDLTTRDKCLVCGAYEAVSAQTPLILSDTPVNRRYFHKGAVYTWNRHDAIAEAVATARAKHTALQEEIVELKAELERSWPDMQAAVEDVLTSRVAHE